MSITQIFHDNNNDNNIVIIIIIYSNNNNNNKNKLIYGIKIIHVHELTELLKYP